MFVNLLLLTGPLYMLQVYDRVLGSRSEATLVALSVLVVFLFSSMGLLDHARARVMARIGAAFQDRLDRRVFEAALRRLTLQPIEPTAIAAQRDLEAVQRLWSSPVLLALFDIPFMPVFIVAIFIFHPYLGWLAVLGGIVLVVITVLNQRVTQGPLLRTNSPTMHAERMADLIKAESEIVQALGMSGAAFDRWQKARGAALQASGQGGRHGGQLFGHLQDLPGLPAIGDAGPRRLAGAEGAADRGCDDRRLDPDGPRPATGRTGGRPMGSGHPRAGRPAPPGRPVVARARRAAAHGTAPPPRGA